MPKFKPLDIYEPVFTTKARYIDLWGGRGRGGSYFASEYFIFKITSKEYFRGFVSRAVYSDIGITIWKALIDRIEENSTLDINDFRETTHKDGRTLTYLPTGWTIQAKGFRSGSGGRTANLKGFEGATHIVIDEAEEITEDQFNQLDDTFRTTKAQIQIIRVFNPPPKNHFIFKNHYNLSPIQLYDKKGNEIEGYYKAESKGSPDHLSIFGTYLDNWENINESTQRKYQNYYYTNPEYYFNQIRGYVSGGAKGVIFKFNRNWFTYSRLPEIEFYELFGLDFGGGGGIQTDEADGSSKTVFSRILINKAAMCIYVKILVYRGYISDAELRTEIINANAKNKEILADNARTDKITDLTNRGFMVIPAKTKEGGSSQIVSGYSTMKEYKIFIHEEDEHAQIELNSHKWAISKATKEPTGQPENKFKDVLDAIRYPVVYYHLNYIF